MNNKTLSGNDWELILSIMKYLDLCFAVFKMITNSKKSRCVTDLQTNQPTLRLEEMAEYQEKL